MTGNSIELDSSPVEIKEFWISYSQMTVPQMLSAIPKWVMINYPTGTVKSFPHPPVCSQGSRNKWLCAKYLIGRYLKNYLNLFNIRKPEKWWRLTKMLLFLAVLSREVAFYLNYDRDGTCIFYLLELSMGIFSKFFISTL